MDFNIFILGKGSKEGTYKYAMSPSVNDAKELVREVCERRILDFKNAKGLQGHFIYDCETGLIKGSSTYLGILANSILAQQGKWLPTIREGVKLDDAKMLSNEVYRDWGIAVYSDGLPNYVVAKSLMQKGYKLPILASFKDLALKTADNAEGLEVVFIDSPTEIIQGEEASKFLKENKFSMYNSGACRVHRGYGSDRDARWNDLDNSYYFGQLDVICAEDTRANLQERLTA